MMPIVMMPIVMRYMDDFVTGEVFELGSFSFTESEIIAYATQFDPQSFHIDPVAAKASIYGGIIASGWHTCGKMMRLVVDSLLKQSSSMGSPGLDEIQWIKPVYAGDVLSMTYVVGAVTPSRSKLDRGMVFSEWKLNNQRGELVCVIQAKGMFGRRPVEG